MNAATTEAQSNVQLSAGSRPARNRETSRERRSRASASLLMVVIGAAFALPLLWIVLASVDAKATWAVELPHLTFQNFEQALSTNGYSMGNSFILAAVSTAIATVCATMAGYAFSRRRLPWKGPLLLGIVFLSAVPLAILVVPVYQMFATIGWLTILPAALFLSVTSLPFEIYLIKNFIDAVPRELEEAALLERAKTWQVLVFVVTPAALPGICAAAIFGFINAWSAFLVPLVLITLTSQDPGTVTIYGYIGSEVTLYGQIAAFSFTFAIPVLLLYLVSGRVFRGGFVLNAAVKG
jgi:multiple sugar transport system permease protein